MFYKIPVLAVSIVFVDLQLLFQVALKSLETVLEKFLHLAEQKTEEAQKTSIEKVEEIDDLDVAIDSPEKSDLWPKNFNKFTIS